MSETQPIELLIADLYHQDWLVRRKTMEALSEIGVAAVEPLIAALRDAAGQVRGCAVSVLGALSDSRAVEPLIAVLKDADENVRKNALSALGQLRDPRAVKPVIAALRDPDLFVRAKAAAALEKISDERAVGPLIAALNDNDKLVHRLAMEALGQIGTAEAQAAVEARRQKPDTEKSGVEQAERTSFFRSLAPFMSRLLNRRHEV